MPKQPARTKTGKARTAKPLPWVPIDEHLKLKEKQTGSMPFAVTDLEKELETGKRRSERRDIRGRREPLSPIYRAINSDMVFGTHSGLIQLSRRISARRFIFVVHPGLRSYCQNQSGGSGLVPRPAHCP